jgi:hypothetical protein
VQWAPGDLLEVARPDAARLSMLHVGFSPNAHRDTQSHLGRVSGLKPGRDIDADQPVRTRLSRDRWIPLVELLSFYNALPPPNFEWEHRNDAIHFHRAVGRQFDITHLLHMRRLIIIGFMENSPLPAPLTVDGQQLPSRGWTVVRWIHPLPPDPN